MLASMPVPVSLLVCTKLQASRREMSVSAAIKENHGIVRQQIAQGANNHLRPERRSFRGLTWSRSVFHSDMRRCASDRKLPMATGGQDRQQCAETRLYVAGQTDFDRIAEPDPVSLRSTWTPRACPARG